MRGCMVETVVVSFSFIFMRTLNMNELQAGTTVVSEEVKETLDNIHHRVLPGII